MKKSLVFIVVSSLLMMFLAADAFGQVVVRFNLNCNVNGATVMLDGKVLGRTPFSGQVTAGTHTVTVSARGYKTVERRVVFRSIVNLTITLERESAPEPRGYKLKIDSNVRGASIFIDDRAAGRTPETITVNRGSITLKVTARGYKDYVTRLNITRDTTVNARLQKAESVFSLSISSNVPRARVYVDDKSMGTAPVRTRLPEGEHFIKVTAPGYEEYAKTIDLRRDLNVKADLERMRRFYNLSISADVRNASVWINNERQKGDAPLTVKLEEGTYEIKVQARGSRPFVTTVKLNKDMRIKADLKPENARIRVIIPDEIARLDRSHRGERIIIFLDGKAQKGVEFEVDRGRHTVRVQAGSWYVEKHISCREGRLYTLRPEFTMDVSEEELRD